jgi:uncharacterized small protein (TIGR04563 family)
VSSPKKKVTLYFNSGMLAETQREAIRQDRSISWIIQAAWKMAREDVKRLPGVGGVPGLPAALPTTPSPPPPVANRSEVPAHPGPRRAVND